ncbi:hypothetical protein TH53_06510 [Pedobacter lusitanus]|uniref:Lipoprotein n=1 Tax=Pedobacter lusitanus TaxID=1503925 RepID=A0A0D0GL56_9SPHI|nr:hypothetical protein [Pedobacter lusitanus]KIO77942.1 hypothetical protein TH53_06510 [Pedobacter lusitanus]
MKNICKILSLLLLLSSCKSTQKLFDKGEYSKAYYAAVNDLKKDPSNAIALGILPVSYREAASKYEQDITLAKNSKGKKGEILDQIYHGYESLQKMYEAVINAKIQTSSFSPKDYSPELNAVATAAAAANYNRGIILLQHQNDKTSARKAYESFKTADTYVPGYKDVIEKKQQAYDAAITNVVVNRLDQRFGYYTINGNFLESDIIWNLNSIGDRNFYKFYSINSGQQAGMKVDQYMDINMYDIWFSNLATNTYSYTTSKNIPVKSDKMAGSTSSKTISATVYVTRRIINSRAVMDYRITDAASQKIIASDRIPAQYTWESLTGRYTGDPAALNARDLAVINGVAGNRPDYNELYRELTRQIMTQFNFAMRDIYR